MKAHWLSCVLGLLCMPAEVVFSTLTASQEPSTISQVRLNSSVEITCSTSLPDPMGFSLRKGVSGAVEVVYLDYQNGRVTKSNIMSEFSGRIQTTQDEQIKEGQRLTLQLSQLVVEETDYYYCSWLYINPQTWGHEALTSNGTIIIVTDRALPQKQCNAAFEDLIFIALTVTACTIAMFLLIALLIVRHRRFKKRFRPNRPARDMKPSRTNRPPRPQHICPQQQHCPYLVTSTSTLDFRGIL